MKALYKTLLGVVAVLTLVPLALAGPPSWDDQINRPCRFKVLHDFHGEAVLDKETGLVWMRTPYNARLQWYTALNVCFTIRVGGRHGWRLPTIWELESLVEPAPNPGPTLPAGHPFTNVQSPGYWSSTPDAQTTDLGAGYGSYYAWYVNFNENIGVPTPGSSGVSYKDAEEFGAWCVRGGFGVDLQ